MRCVSARRWLNPCERDPVQPPQRFLAGRNGALPDGGVPGRLRPGICGAAFCRSVSGAPYARTTTSDGDAWSSFPHDHARSRVYRWGGEMACWGSAISSSACVSPLLYGMDRIRSSRSAPLAWSTARVAMVKISRTTTSACLIHPSTALCVGSINSLGSVFPMSSCWRRAGGVDGISPRPSTWAWCPL